MCNQNLSRLIILSEMGPTHYILPWLGYIVLGDYDRQTKVIVRY